jgi:peroxiredoxin Q/BCP
MIEHLAHKLPGPVRRRLKRSFMPEILREGTQAVSWRMADQDGRWHAHHEHWYVLAFYPADGTRGCSRPLFDLAAHRGALEAVGCAIYGVNSGDAASHARFASDLGLGFPLLVDEDGAATHAWRCELDLPLIGSRTIRTVYLVNPKGRIRLANRGAPAAAVLVRSIQALQQATRDGV